MALHFILLIFFCFSLSAAFPSRKMMKLKSRFQLFPIENIEELHPFLPEISSTMWRYYLLEPRDIVDAAELSTKCFFKPKVVLKKDDMSIIEKAIFGSVESVLHSFDRAECWISNYLGYKNRLGNRGSKPTLSISRDAIIIAATSTENPSQIIGLIELSLEKPNGFLPMPFISPFQSNSQDLSEFQPYLSNLSIDPVARRKGLSRKLCQLVETISSKLYQKSEIYLHVLKDNTAARNLYDSLGYSVVDRLTEEEILRYRMEDIVFYYKSLK